jgi:DNA-binding response OmpR family regulator
MHILLVEDERRLATAVKRVLEEEGHVEDHSDDGGDAFAQARSEDYDVIVLDVMLPTMNGYDIARRLRAGGDATPILMLTARDSIQDRVQGLDSGADDYRLSPLPSPSCWPAPPSAGASRWSRQAATSPRRPSWTCAPRKATRDGRRTLTSKEFALLEALMRHQASAHTVAALELVWN